MTKVLLLKKLVLGLFLMAVVGLGTAVSTRADSYTLNTTNFGAPGSNFGTITTALVGNTIQVQVTLAAGYVIHGQGVGFNVVGDQAGVNVTGISNALFTYPGGSGNLDGYGTFAFSVAGPNTSTARTNNLNSVTFTVSRTAGFTNANQLGFLNNQGQYFAVQIAPTDPQANTGFAGSNQTATPEPRGNPTPEPASMLLLGTGLIGVAGAARRRFKSHR